MQLTIKNGSLDLSGEQILRHIDFEITDNSRIALVGRNGCGKTSLLKIISGEYSLTNGNITLSGKPKSSFFVIFFQCFIICVSFLFSALIVDGGADTAQSFLLWFILVFPITGATNLSGILWRIRYASGLSRGGGETNEKNHNPVAQSTLSPNFLFQPDGRHL